jgi:homoserine kinase type II
MTAEDALRVAASFGVDVRGAAAVSLPGGYSNESWRVTGPGAGVVVRRYGRLHVSRAALEFEHAVAAHWAAHGADVRAPLAGGDGATLRLERGGFVAALPWIEGETGRRDPATGAAAAAALARIHLAGRDMHVASGMRSTRFLGILPWLIACFQRFAAAGSPTARALPWDELILAVGASTARVATRAVRLPAAILHGDPHPGNVVVNGGRVCGVIDFDFVHESERVCDVGALLDEFARTDDDAPLDLARIAPLVAAYEAQAPLTPDEREALPDAMLRRAATLVWYVVTRHGERAPGDIGGAPRYAARVREIAGALEEIRRAA